jgi:hypothetical protein
MGFFVLGASELRGFCRIHRGATGDEAKRDAEDAEEPKPGAAKAGG